MEGGIHLVVFSLLLMHPPPLPPFCPVTWKASVDNFPSDGFTNGHVSQIFHAKTSNMDDEECKKCSLDALAGIYKLTAAGRKTNGPITRCSSYGEIASLLHSFSNLVLLKNPLEIEKLEGTR